ncbi:hypothetical protein ACOIPX_005693 [Salmonella enterica]
MNNEKTTQTAAKDGPHIDAGSLSLEEFRTWIRHRQRNAFRYEETHTWISELRCICQKLREFTDYLPGVISDLQDPQIARSADHASELLKEISFYRTLQEAMENFLSATELSKTDPPALWRRYGWKLEPEPEQPTSEKDR